MNVYSSTILKEPWNFYTALIVFPGGADLQYCREFNGEGNTIISQYVRRGGRFLGFCAGGYYGSSRVEFEVGNKEMEVSGSRELKFFPGVARGAVYKGFEYGNHAKAIAASIEVNKSVIGESQNEIPEELFVYCNGGCVFVDAEKYKSNGIEVIARYKDDLEVKGSDIGSDNIDHLKPAAVVYAKVGEGSVILSGVHPEFSPDLLKRFPEDQVYSENLQKLIDSQSKRVELMRSLLAKLGLKVDQSPVPIPGLSRLCLSSSSSTAIPELIEKIKTEIGLEDNVLKGSNDTFHLNDSNDHFFSESQPQIVQESSVTEDELFNPNIDKVVKEIDVYYSGYPDDKIVSNFDHALYYNSLENFRNEYAQIGATGEEIGSVILYGDVVTSTSTMLYKNFNLLRVLPDGFAAIGSIQIAGRGRGNNVWVNPPGVLASSTVHRMPLHDRNNLPSPMVFTQYIVSLAMVEAIKSYGSDYEDFPVSLKWPNDIYCTNPDYNPNSTEEGAGVEFYKVGGCLVNTNILDSEYVLVVGIGVNVNNHAPSTSLNTIVNKLNNGIRKSKNLPPLKHFTTESLLARFYTIAGMMLTRFRYMGFGAFEDLYYKRWLHTGKIVTLEQHNHVKAKIVGISNDYGMLVVEEVDRENRPTGKTYELQPDGNSFDMMKGLLKKKN